MYIYSVVATGEIRVCAGERWKILHGEIVLGTSTLRGAQRANDE